MRSAVVCVVVWIGCNSDASINPDASTRPDDSTPTPPPQQCEAPGLICPSPLTQLCGNNKVDHCYWRLMPHRCTFVPGPTEPCDGTAIPTDCMALGFYGGAVSCTACQLDTTSCDACGAAATGCASLDGFDLRYGLAVSGDFIALAGFASVAIHDGLSPVTEVAIADVRAITGVAGGWLVATAMPPTLSTLDTSGTRGPARPLPAAATDPVLATGPGDGVVVAWNEQVNGTWRVFAAIADATGTVVVPASDLFASDGSTVSATSDGASFFVGANGKLARITSDGGVLVTTGFPFQSDTTGVADLSWHGATGWYVSWSAAASAYRGQRFDATGTAVGPVRQIQGGPMLDFLGEGDELRGFKWGGPSGEPRGIELRRYTTTGGVVSEGMAGASSSPTYTRAVHHGDDVIVAWTVAGRTVLVRVP